MKGLAQTQTWIRSARNGTNSAGTFSHKLSDSEHFAFLNDFKILKVPDLLSYLSFVGKIDQLYSQANTPVVVKLLDLILNTQTYGVSD